LWFPLMIMMMMMIYSEKRLKIRLSFIVDDWLVAGASTMLHRP
jgi:hypothetical protein